jgi:hypothetical protein
VQNCQHGSTTTRADWHAMFCVLWQAADAVGVLPHWHIVVSTALCCRMDLPVCVGATVCIVPTLPQCVTVSGRLGCYTAGTSPVFRANDRLIGHHPIHPPSAGCGRLSTRRLTWTGNMNATAPVQLVFWMQKHRNLWHHVMMGCVASW